MICVLLLVAAVCARCVVLGGRVAADGVTVTELSPGNEQPGTEGCAPPTNGNVGPPLVVLFSALRTSAPGFPTASVSLPANISAAGVAVASSTASEPESPSPMKLWPSDILATTISSL